MKQIKPAASIPTKVKGKELILKSQNIQKIKQYEFDHFLDKVNQPKRIDKFTEQVPPLPCQFKQRQVKEIITLPEFIQMENPPPFGGAQAVNDKDDQAILEEKLQMELFQYLKIKQLKQEEQQERYSSIHEDNYSDTIVTIENIQHELQKEHDQYIEKFVKKLEEEKIEKKVQEFVRLPLPELLKIPNQFPIQKKDQYRALSAQDRKQVQNEHEVKQSEIKAEIPKKSLQEMEKMIEETKKDYFKIIRDLDFLNKGARQLKNATSQQYGIRKKVDEPNIEKLIKQVKDTIWYTEGLTNGFDREMALIQHKNSQAKNLIDINKVLEQSDLQEQNQQIIINKEEIPARSEKQEDKKLNNSSLISQKTQASAKTVTKVVNSKKGKELQDMMSDDLF
ncbi:unnamed protein product (macronuclear) [Paramecium tetraurelia]|uniref:Uncharacterized protein n=1 Tax=Paramecium tetraurelia TaxID=5888 RepID=A0BT01_PARTE|nr:uncharacterized protein GSPATT00031900001 [Paramecium tetraurelia]CAK61668.1 unnamed protein product [Paramecium tetraurelia]|eukprot:XP_001429066.1 hypothetical protein (macronuclear) [Paramecium tetraurelia strain d4-2]